METSLGGNAALALAPNRASSLVKAVLVLLLSTDLEMLAALDGVHVTGLASLALET